MQSFFGRCANLYNPTQIRPVLNGLADECCGMLASLVAYAGALALLAIVGIHLWDQLPAREAAEASVKAGWSVATRAHPAFAVSQFDLAGKTETYEILRHPGGGRKDLLRWTVPDGKHGQKPVAEFEIYRPGGESNESGPLADLAARMDPDGLRELAQAGQLHRVSHVGHIGGLGDRRGKPQAARHFLTELADAAGQDAGLHATFSHSAALL
jgi:hypothetical protein